MAANCYPSYQFQGFEWTLSAVFEIFGQNGCRETIAEECLQKEPEPIFGLDFRVGTFRRYTSTPFVSFHYQ